MVSGAYVHIEFVYILIAMAILLHQQLQYVCTDIVVVFMCIFVVEEFYVLCVKLSLYLVEYNL